MKNVFMSVESTKPAENWICKVSRYLSIFEPAIWTKNSGNGRNMTENYEEMENM